MTIKNTRTQRFQNNWVQISKFRTPGSGLYSLFHISSYFLTLYLLTPVTNFTTLLMFMNCFEINTIFNDHRGKVDLRKTGSLGGHNSVLISLSLMKYFRTGKVHITL